MRRELLIATILMALAASVGLAQAQESAGPDGQKTLAATVKVYVFPKAGQDAQQQSQDEAACYAWAVENTGVDPFEVKKKAQDDEERATQKQQQAAQAGRGAGARGAVAGAAAGALIGEIADDDAGEGAAIGAGVGMMAGRRRARAARGRAEAEAAREADEAKAARKQQKLEFKKAFSVCLEAKDYLVKY